MEGNTRVKKKKKPLIDSLSLVEVTCGYCATSRGIL